MAHVPSPSSSPKRFQPDLDRIAFEPVYPSTPSPSTHAGLDAENDDAVSSIVDLGTGIGSDAEVDVDLRDPASSSSSVSAHSSFGQAATAPQRPYARPSRPHARGLGAESQTKAVTDRTTAAQVQATVEASASTRQAYKIIRRHYLGLDIRDLAENPEACELCISPDEYDQLRSLLQHDADYPGLLSYFEDDLRHDYIARRNCLTLRLMAAVVHEQLKAKIRREIERGLGTIGQDLQRELTRLGQEAAQRQEGDAEQANTIRSKELTAVRTIAQVVDEIDPDNEHAFVKFASNATKRNRRSPDVQFCCRSQHPQFVGEIGYSQRIKSLKLAAKDYIELSDDIKTVLLVSIAYNQEDKRQGQPGEQAPGQGQEEAPRVPEREEAAQSDRSAMLWLYRNTKRELKAVFRDKDGHAQDGNITFYLSDFLSPQTIQEMEQELQPSQAKWHPSALEFSIPFARMYDILRLAEAKQAQQHEAPPPVKLKRKMEESDDGSDRDDAQSSAPKRQRITSHASSPSQRRLSARLTGHQRGDSMGR